MRSEPKREETNMRKLNAILIIAMAFILAAPCIALADKKKVNSKPDNPTESLSLSYGKVQWDYKAQTGNTGKKSVTTSPTTKTMKK